MWRETYSNLAGKKEISRSAQHLGCIECERKGGQKIRYISFKFQPMSCLNLATRRTREQSSPAGQHLPHPMATNLQGGSSSVSETWQCWDSVSKDELWADPVSPVASASIGKRPSWTFGTGGQLDCSNVSKPEMFAWWNSLSNQASKG